MCVPTIRTPAVPGALEEIDRLLESIWSVNPQVPDSVRTRLGIAVGEISTNIIKHATDGLNRGVVLEMWVLVRDNDVVVTFADDGIPAGADLLSREMPPEFDESGRGIPLARATLSLLEYRRTDGVNVWTLVSDRF
jgi:serine/threonine-protein kinase RsbW